MGIAHFTYVSFVGTRYLAEYSTDKGVSAYEKAYSRDALVEFSGMRLTTQSIGPKIVWIKENESDIYNQTHKFITATSYVIYKLTGRIVIDAHTSTEWNPLLDIKNIAWDGRFADKITTLDKLPEIGWSSEVAGMVTSVAADETGIPAGLPLVAAAADKACEVIGSGSLESNIGCLSYGTTATVKPSANAREPLVSISRQEIAWGHRGRYA